MNKYEWLKDAGLRYGLPVSTVAAKVKMHGLPTRKIGSRLTVERFAWDQLMRQEARRPFVEEEHGQDPGQAV